MVTTNVGIGVVKETLLVYLQPKLVDEILGLLSDRTGVALEVDEEIIEGVLKDKLDSHLLNIESLRTTIKEEEAKQVANNVLVESSLKKISETLNHLTELIPEALDDCVSGLNLDFDNQVDEGIQEGVDSRLDDIRGGYWRVVDTAVADFIRLLLQTDIKKYNNLSDVPHHLRNEIKQYLSDTILKQIFNS